MWQVDLGPNPYRRFGYDDGWNTALEKAAAHFPLGKFDGKYVAKTLRDMKHDTHNT